MRIVKITACLAFSGLLLAPAFPGFDAAGNGAAFAKSEKSEASSDKGKGQESSSKSSKSVDADKKATPKASKASKKAAPKTTADAKKPVAKKSVGKKAVETVSPELAATELTPNQLGKMNGALHANINAVLAHIKNGQTTNGPVGLLAGLAIADTAAATAAAEAAELQALADDFDALDTALSDAGFASVEDYLAAKADGTLTDEEIAAIDPLIEAVGGLDSTETALANTAPTDEEIAAAEEAALAAQSNVTTAEQSIGDAWNKDGDLSALLVALRAKLAPYQDLITETVGQTAVVTESTSTVAPETVTVIE